MGKTILVAGAGHGGLAAAADLARKGYDVTLLEQKAEQEQQEKMITALSVEESVHLQGQHDLLPARKERRAHAARAGQ